MTKIETIRAATKNEAIEKCQVWLDGEMSEGVRAAIPNTNNLIMVGPQEWIAKNLPGVEAKAQPTIYTQEFTDLIIQLKKYPALSAPVDELIAYCDSFVQSAVAASLASQPQAEPVAYLHTLPQGEVFNDEPDQSRQICWSRAEADQALIAHGGTIYPIGYMAPAASIEAAQKPAGWVFGNSFWERDNPRTPDEVKRLGRPLFAAPMGREAQVEPEGYGDTEFGFTFAGVDMTEGDKRLAAMLVKALGTAHPAMDDFASLLFRARPAATVAQGEQADEVRDAALEVAARACDNLHRKWKWDDELDSSSGPRECAAAIRKLKRAGDTGEQADGGGADE